MDEREAWRLKVLEKKEELRRQGYIYQISLYGRLEKREPPHELIYRRIEILAKTPFNAAMIAACRSTFARLLPLKEYTLWTIDEDGQLHPVVVK